MRMAAALVLFSVIPLTPQQRAKVSRLEERLLAPCCYSQPISVHRSDAAEQMREEVTEMVASGMTEEEVINHYKLEYGERILVVPDGTTGKTLFATPVAVFVLCSGILFLVLRRTLRIGMGPPTIAGTEDAARVRRELLGQIEREVGDHW